LLERHRWNAQTRSVSDGFGGGRCGGAAPAQGRPLAADRPYKSTELSAYPCSPHSGSQISCGRVVSRMETLIATIVPLLPPALVSLIKQSSRLRPIEIELRRQNDRKGGAPAELPLIQKSVELVHRGSESRTFIVGRVVHWCLATN